MSGLKFTLDPSSSLPDKPLSATDVGVDLAGGTIGYETEPQLTGIKFVLGVQGNASVGAFNSKDDKDPDGILGKPIKADTEFGEVELPPQIHLTEDSAWLKYRLAAKAKVGISGTISPADYKIDGSKEIIFADYRIYPKNTNTRSAVLHDLQRIRFAANAADAFELADKEALLYHVRGELTASITLSWSDVFTSSLSSLTHLLKSGRMLSIQISPSASVKFHVGLIDDFRLVLSKGTGNKVCIAIKKSDSRELGVTASLGVTAKFANEKDVDDVLTKLFESVVGAAKSQLKKILTKATFEDLSDNERTIINGIIERLGLGDVIHKLDELKKQLEVLEEEITKIIKTVAKAKIELGFTYEYMRVRTEDTLLIVELDQNTYRQFHNDLILFKVIRLFDWVEDNPSALKSYLNQKTLKRSQAWGFTLGIGGLKLGGKDKKELKWIEQKNSENKRRMACLGMRRYDSNLFKDKAGWVVDFKAQMSEFSPHQTPTACEFQYGLHFKCFWAEKKLGEKELRRYLDNAIIWRVLALGNIREVIDKAKKSLRQQAEVSVEFTMDDKVLRTLLGMAAAAPNDKLGARALAKAMPYMEDYDGRCSPILREYCYAPLWEYYFKNDDLPITIYPSVAADTIEKITQLEHERELASRERGFGMPAYKDVYTFAGQIYYQGNSVAGDYAAVHRNWLKFVEGMNSLNTVINPSQCASYKTIEGVFKLMSEFWSQWLYIRAAGAYLMDLAATRNDLLKKINRTCTISFKNGNTYTFSSSV